jgi:glycosidase
MAYTFLFTTRGIPQLYYGDELGLGGGEDPDNRRDFPGGWSGDARNAFEASGRTADEQRVFAHLQSLTRLRRERPELATVRTEQLLVQEQQLVYRRGRTLVVINNASAPITLRVPGLGATGPAVIGGCGPVTREGADGVVVVTAKTACGY